MVACRGVPQLGARALLQSDDVTIHFALAVLHYDEQQSNDEQLDKQPGEQPGKDSGVSGGRTVAG